MSYEYFIETAPSYREAVELVSEKYGEHATIVKKRQKMIGGFLGMFRKDAVEVSGYVSLEPIRRKPARVTPAAAPRATAAPAATTADLESAKQKVLEAAGVRDGGMMTKILSELQNLREEVAKGAEVAPVSTDSELKSIAAIRELLEENEFSRNYIDHILRRCKALSMEQLEDSAYVEQQVLDWISESIFIHEETPRSRPRIVVLVGPTGVGKTTTIAKLAAQYHLGKVDGIARSVRVITIDNYRIGARKQIETYGEIMGIPVECAETGDELKKWIDLYHDVDLIFIDTIGRSPNEFETLGRMNTLLQSCGQQAEIHLAVSACTRSSDIRRIMQQFEPFNYGSVIITKTDETSSLGSIISCLWEKNKRVSFLTHGQSVPNDIRKAARKHFLLRLAGFRVDREKLEQPLEKIHVE